MRRRHDPLTPQERSERMSRVRNVDTKPEMIVRRLVHGMGYRYRLHKSGLPGKPDLVFARRMKIIFVNGCFWHQHGCGKYRMPKSRKRFWNPKLKRNVQRDKRVRVELAELDWEVMTVWECELGDLSLLRERIVEFLG